MFILDGKPLSPDVAFTATDADGQLIQFPANWLRLSTPEQRAAIGITEQVDPPSWDQRWAWGYDADGHLIWKDHTQLVEQWVAQTRATAGTLLVPSDWLVIREQDNGTAVPTQWKDWRQAIRMATGDKVAAIEATTTTEELAAYITGADYPMWPADPNQPQPEPPVEDTISFEGGVTSGQIVS
jgi:hypothetical protein